MACHSGVIAGEADQFTATLAASAMPAEAKVDKLTMARRRMAAKNSSIAISLADHAERVAMKKARSTADGETQTAAERLAALRRRISERRGGGTVPGDGEHGSAAACTRGEAPETGGAPTSIEDDKIHFIGDSNLSFVDAAASSRGEGVEADGTGRTGSAACGGGGRDSATASAAATWAQHAVLRRGAVDDDRQLSAA